jgi:hypothetical protein
MEIFDKFRSSRNLLPVAAHPVFGSVHNKRIIRVSPSPFYSGKSGTIFREIRYYIPGNPVLYSGKSGTGISLHEIRPDLYIRG